MNRDGRVYGFVCWGVLWGGWWVVLRVVRRLGLRLACPRVLRRGLRLMLWVGGVAGPAVVLHVHGWVGRLALV